MHEFTHTKEKPFECELCNQRYTCKSALLEHIQGHSGIKSHFCNVCGKSFTEKELLKIHMINHTFEKPYPSDDRGTRLSIVSLETKFSCELCEKCFATKSNLGKHLRLHHSNLPLESIECEACGLVLKNKDTLRVHQYKHTGNYRFICEICGKGFVARNKLIIHQLIHTGDKPHVCEICQNSFSQKCSLKAHMLKHSGEKPHVCSICSKSFRLRSTLQKHLLVHTGERPYSCDICNNGFCTRYKLKKHRETHFGEGSYKCELCDSSFSSISSLKQHSLKHIEINNVEFCHHKLIHTEDQGYVCEFCNKRFNNPDGVEPHSGTQLENEPNDNETCKGEVNSLKLQTQTRLEDELPINIKNFGSGTKPLKTLCMKDKSNFCKKCKKDITFEKNPKSHACTPTGKRHYTCETCGDEFFKKIQLRKHLVSHMSEKQLCGICKMNYSEIKFWNKHLLTVSGEDLYICKDSSMDIDPKMVYRHSTILKQFVCEFCKKGFSCKTALERHVLAHSTERPYACEICNKSFKDKYALKGHKIFHASEPSFPCPVCNKGFMCKSGVKKHLQKNHLDSVSTNV